MIRGRGLQDLRQVVPKENDTAGRWARRPGGRYHYRVTLTDANGSRTRTSFYGTTLRTTVGLRVPLPRFALTGMREMVRLEDQLAESRSGTAASPEHSPSGLCPALPIGQRSRQDRRRRPTE